jgi:hypothetical protein
MGVSGQRHAPAATYVTSVIDVDVLVTETEVEYPNDVSGRLVVCFCCHVGLYVFTSIWKNHSLPSSE